MGHTHTACRNTVIQHKWQTHTHSQTLKTGHRGGTQLYTPTHTIHTCSDTSILCGFTRKRAVFGMSHSIQCLFPLSVVKQQPSEAKTIATASAALTMGSRPHDITSGATHGQAEANGHRHETMNTHTPTNWVSAHNFRLTLPLKLSETPWRRLMTVFIFTFQNSILFFVFFVYNCMLFRRHRGFVWQRLWVFTIDDTLDKPIRGPGFNLGEPTEAHEKAVGKKMILRGVLPGLGQCPLFFFSCFFVRPFTYTYYIHAQPQYCLTHFFPVVCDKVLAYYKMIFLQKVFTFFCYWLLIYFIVLFIWVAFLLSKVTNTQWHYCGTQWHSNVLRNCLVLASQIWIIFGCLGHLWLSTQYVWVLGGWTKNILR